MVQQAVCDLFEADPPFGKPETIKELARLPRVVPGSTQRAA